MNSAIETALSYPSPKLAPFEQFAIVAKALSSAPRLDLLELLAQASGLSIANTSQHLQVLRRSGLATSRKVGTHVLYSLTACPTTMCLTCWPSCDARSGAMSPKWTGWCGAISGNGTRWKLSRAKNWR
ncbi:MAG: arsR, partial [Rhodospirillaceae bacterium]